MNSFVNYIVEAGMSLGVFTLVYWFILRGETRFKATRFYLLFALLFSTLLPFLTIRMNTFVRDIEPQAADDAVFAGTNLLETVTVYASGIPAKIGNVILLFDYTMLIYALGAVAALFVISAGIFQLWSMVAKNRVFKLKHAKLVVSSRDISPYSFFNYIFIGKNLTGKHNWKTMVHHEMEHVKQGHSFDVLFVDFMMIFQWFNPFYWILRRMVRENHEFLADTGVLSKGLISNAQYKVLLLSQAIGGRPVITSNFFNMKTVKKRFKMITNKKNNKFGIIRYSIGIFAALALTLLFACERNESILSVEKGVQYVYDGKLVSADEISALDINYMISDEVDKLEVLTAYPEFREEALKSDRYMLVFDYTRSDHIEIMKRMDVNNFEYRVNNPTLHSERGSSNSEDEVFIIVEEMPEFIGGQEALRTHLAEEIRYPHIAAENGKQGRVYVEFVVGADGFVRNPKVVRGVDPALDAEALRVVSELPRWKPGVQRGVPVAVSFTVPINFQLN